MKGSQSFVQGFLWATIIRSRKIDKNGDRGMIVIIIVTSVLDLKKNKIKHLKG